MAACSAITPRSRWLTAALFFAAFLALTCYTTARGEEESELNLQPTYAALLAAGDADSLAAAAAVGDVRSVTPEQRLALLSSAVTLAPARADLAWLQLEACTRVAACDAEPIAMRLHVLDAANGDAWLPLLDRATKRNDAAGVAKYLSSIASSTRFDVYWTAAIAQLSRAVIRTHTVDVRSALLAVIGGQAALSVPALQTLAHACGADALGEPGRVASCRQIAHAMRGGDCYVVELVGTAIERRVWPEGSPQYLDAVAARKVAHYQILEQSDIPGAALLTEAHASQLLELMSTKRKEQEVAAAIIKAAARDPMPPPGWTDSRDGG
jgi:hypothetical protein